MKQLSVRRLGLAVLAGAAAALPAHAGWAPDSMFVGVGRSARDTVSAEAGLRWNWDRSWRGGRVTGATEVLVSQWRAEWQDGHQGFTQLAVVPVLRMRLTKAPTPWFVEGGIGLSLHDRAYHAHGAQMSTRWNFHDVLAAGRGFGAAGRHELSLRLVHVSNGGIRKPNPGEDLVALRYALRF